MKFTALFTALLGLSSELALAQMSQVDRQLLPDVNLVENGGFENGLAKWTNAGSGALVKTTTAANVGAGTTAAAWDAAANDDTLTSNPQTIPAGIFGQDCAAVARVKGGDTALTLQVVDGSVNVLGSVALTSNVGFTKYTVEFTCPSSGTLAVRLHSSGDAAAAYVDQVRMGLLESQAPLKTAGEPNVIRNPYAERNTNGFSSTGTATISRLAAGGPLSPMVPSGFRIDGGSAADVARSCFQIPENYKKRRLKVSWEQTPEGGASNGEWRFEAYSSANSDCSSPIEIKLSTDDTSGDSLIPAIGGRFWSSFDTDGNSYYEIRWVRVSGSSHLDLTELIVGAGVTSQGPTVSPRLGWIPTGSWTTNATYTGFQWRIGDRWSARGQVATTGAPTATSLSINMPANTTIDAGGMPGVSGEVTYIGDAVIVDSSTSDRYSGKTLYTHGTNGSFTVRYQAQSANTITTLDRGINGISQTGPMTWAAGDYVNFSVEGVPIAEWAGSGTVNIGQNDVQYISHDGTNIVYGSAGAAIPTTTPSGTVDDYDITTGIRGDFRAYSYKLEVQHGGLGPWLPLPNNDIENLQYDGTNFFGAGLRTGGADAVKMVRGKYRRQVGSSTSWAGVTAGTRWRVVVSIPGVAVGFGLATLTNSGLIPSNAQNSFAPNLVKSSGSGTLGAATVELARYVKIGALCMIELVITPITVSTNTIEMAISLPFPAKSSNRLIFHSVDNSTAGTGRIITSQGSATASVTPSLTSSLWAVSSASSSIRGSFVYEVAE